MPLILIRGLPGSGKSTAAEFIKSLCPAAEHFEADMYFDMFCSGHFEPLKLAEAHSWCFGNTQKALKAGKTLIVSNTFVKQAEMAEYIDLANGLGEPIFILKAEWFHKGVSSHQVAATTIEKMKKNWYNL